MIKTKEITNRMIAAIAGGSFLLLIVVWFLVGYIQQIKNQYLENFDPKWDIAINGETRFQEQYLEDVNFGELQINDTLDLYTTLTDDLNGGDTIQMLVYLCSVEAYVDDELVYSYGADLVGKDVMIGSGYHFIDLPEDVSGKVLHLHMIMNEPDAYTSIPTMQYTPTELADVAFARSQMINALVGIFLLILGLMVAVVSLVLTVISRSYVRLVYIGLFSMFMGSWTILTNKVAQIFSADRISNTSLEYLALYCAPVPFALLMCEIRKNDNSWRRIAVVGATAVLLAFAGVSTFLHYSNIVRYPKMLIIFHTIGFVSIFIMAYAGYFTVKDKSKSEILMAVDVLLVITVLGMDLVRFNVQKYLFPNSIFLMNSFIPIGILIFIVLLIVSYLIYMYDMVLSQAEADTLTKMAYHDVLTGLFNRAKYEETMLELNASDEDFALISIDLNDLKYANDTFGHDKGDKMLTLFSELLRKNFETIGKCFRTGGDEFIVIVDSKHMTEINNALSKLNADEAEISAQQIIELHASYGVAYRSEIHDREADRVFRLADRRMYEMKSESKGREYVFATGNNK